MSYPTSPYHSTDVGLVDSNSKEYSCSHCDKLFTCSENRDRHERLQHSTSINTASAPLSNSCRSRKRTTHISKKKPRKACHRCRKHKLKCDLKHPTCQNCQKSEDPCTWEETGVGVVLQRENNTTRS